MLTPVSYAELCLNTMYRKEGYVLFNDALNTFNLRLYGIRHMVKGHSDNEETCCRHMGYSFRLAARVLLYASSHRQDNTYHSLCYTSHGALGGTRNKTPCTRHSSNVECFLTELFLIKLVLHNYYHVFWKRVRCISMIECPLIVQ